MNTLCHASRDVVGYKCALPLQRLPRCDLAAALPAPPAGMLAGTTSHAHRRTRQEVGIQRPSRLGVGDFRFRGRGEDLGVGVDSARRCHGARNTQKAVLLGLLAPQSGLIAAENAGAAARRLSLFEDWRSLPWGAVWDEHCARHERPRDGEWMDAVDAYTKNVLSRRDPL